MHSTKTVLPCVLTLGLLVLCVRPAHAQHEEPPHAPDALVEDDLGFTYRYTLRDPNAGAGFLALSPVGMLVHGVGHFNADDPRTGRALLLGELVSVVMMGTGFLISEFTNEDGDLAVSYRSLVSLGASLFVATWLFDVIGAFKGNRYGFPEHAGSLDHLGLTVGYTQLFDLGLPLQNTIFADVELDFGEGYFNPRFATGLNAEYLRFGVATGLRFDIGRRELSYFRLGAEFDEVLFGSLGHAYESIVGVFGFSVDLGDLIAHLDNVVYQAYVGGGIQLLRFDFDESAGPLSGDSNISQMILDSSISANFLDPLLLEVGYSQRPDQLVGTISPSLGAFFATVTYRAADFLDIFVDGRTGQGFQIYSGTSFYLRR